MSIAIRMVATMLVPSLMVLGGCGSSTSSGSGNDEGGAGNSSGGGSSNGSSSGSAPSGMCGNQACSGCCDTTGACQTGPVDTYCGTEGVACEDCTAAGLTCQSGVCAGGGTGTASSGGGASSSGGGFSRDAGLPPIFDGGILRNFDAGREPVRDAGLPPAFDAGIFDFDAARRP